MAAQDDKHDHIATREEQNVAEYIAPFETYPESTTS